MDGSRLIIMAVADVKFTSATAIYFSSNIVFSNSVLKGVIESYQST
ncbi:hypothetical protein ACQKL5_19260 [Peribacillus sp. NPDC097675]